MKVLCVSNTSFFLYNSFLPVMGALRASGDRVIAVAPADEWTDRLAGEGFPFIPLHHFDRKSANPVKDLRLMREFLAVYRGEQPDVVLHFTIKANVYGSIAARLARTRSICTVTGLGWLFTERSLKTLIGGTGYKILYRIALSTVERLVLLNHDDLSFFLHYGLMKRERCVVIPGQGVNTDRFSPVDRDDGEPGPRFLLIARMLWDKGIGEYMAAARMVKERHPEARFSLLGPIDTENRAAIPETVIRQWEQDGWAEYLGKTDDVRSFIAASDVVVLPSYREGVPSVLLEAMAMGKPIIATDVPGTREVVEDGKNGILAAPKDAGALAQAFERFFALTTDEKARMGAEGRQRAVERYDERIVTGLYVGCAKQAATAPLPTPLLKRLFDVLLSTFGLFLSAPVWMAIASAVKAGDGGPVFYTQERMGKGGSIFRVLKFRSMVVDAERETGAVWASEHDQRVTRIGRLLRATAMDELPQLWNILKGEMSFVGPRAERPSLVEQFARDIKDYHARFAVIPGLTGLAQVYGQYDTPPHRKVRYDRLYIKKYSFGLDLKLIFLSFLITFKGKWELRGKKVLRRDAG